MLKILHMNFNLKQESSIAMGCYDGEGVFSTKVVMMLLLAVALRKMFFLVFWL